MSNKKNTSNNRRNIDDKILLKFEKLNNSIEKVGTQVDHVLEYNDRQDKKINDIHTVIHGNGEPEKGLATKFSRLDEKIKSILKHVNIHWALISSILLAAIVVIIRSL